MVVDPFVSRSIRGSAACMARTTSTWLAPLILSTKLAFLVQCLDLETDACHDKIARYNDETLVALSIHLLARARDISQPADCLCWLSRYFLCVMSINFPSVFIYLFFFML